MDDRRIRLLRFVLRVAEATWYYIRTVSRIVGEHDILFLASGIAFNGVLTLIPLMLLMASALGMFLNSSAEGVKQLNDILTTLFPPQPFAQQIRSSITDVLTGIVMHRTSLGVAGFVALMWTATSLFDAVRSVLHRVYNAERKQGLLASLLNDFGFILLVFLLFVAANLTIWVSSLAEKVAKDLPVVGFGLLARLQGYVPTLVVVVMTALMFYILYRHITDDKPPKGVAVVATVTSTVLWLVAGKIFSLYLSGYSNIGSIYGTYAFLLVLLFWIYYSSLTFVFGAMVGQAYWQRLRYLRAQHQP